MVIAIDLTALSYHITGIERFALCISENLLKIDQKNKYILVFRDEIYSSFNSYVDNNRIKVKILHGNNKLFFNQLVLPAALYNIKADVFLFMAFTSPILFFKKNIITTIHDVGAWDFPNALGLLQKVYCRVGCSVSAKVATKIITVSEFSKNRISEVLRIDKKKIYVVNSAVSEFFKEKTISDELSIFKEYNLPDKYIMTLSTLEPRKNMELLLKAFSNIQDKVDYDLVLVGRKGWKMDEILEKYNSKERIHITDFVRDEHVAVIYKNALCFVFPTLYEGFGLPPVEALSMGTPVISSNAASMPEILRNQAVYFKSNDQRELERLLLHLEENVDTMPHELDEYQKNNYKFDVSAKKILKLIGELPCFCQ